MTVRVRFAPSPTGEPHVGNIRTALFNWLFARHSNGVFIVRVEDTDQKRLVEGAIDSMVEGLRWLGLEWDEGPEVGGPFSPYVQSQRLDLYRAAADRLIANNRAYRCFCPSARLDEVRKAQQARKEPPRYDRRCRNLPEEEKRSQPDAVDEPVVRLAIPESGVTTVHDLLRGDMRFENALLDDLVLLKSDGYPTYHLANIVDDHEMEISHVLRGEDWLSSTPRHVILYQAFGWEPPIFVHLSNIVGPDKAKLSKRHGATSLLAYRDQGFLPETMVNFLALLGWSYDDKTEIMTSEELIERFTLERIGKTSAVFNHDKLAWMNGAYLRKMPVNDLADRLLPWIESGVPEAAPLDRDYLRAIVPLIQERIKLLSEASDLTAFFFVEPLDYESVALLGKKGNLDPKVVRRGLQAARELIENQPIDSEHIEGPLREEAGRLGLKVGELFGAVRVAVTGSAVSPPLIETMAVLGVERSLARLAAAIDRLPDPA